MKNARITVRLPLELRRRLKAAANRSGRQESALIRAAIERELAADEGAPTAYDRAKKAGIVGIVRGTPPDLSTNPKYFEGFGRS
jgi:predicted DNA-binding protein